MGNSEFKLLLDSSILWDFWTMLTKKNSIVFVTLRSSTDVFPCLPSLETSSPVPESTFQEPLTRPETNSTPSLTVGPPFLPSQLLDLPKSSFSLDSLSLEL